MSSPSESRRLFSSEERQLLREEAFRSIRYGLETGRVLQVKAEDYPDALREQLASFVTLNINGALRGCIGHLEAIQPVIIDVVENAHAAAFRDPRFPPLSKPEHERLELHISILTPSSPMEVTGERDLLEQLRPGVDGLILQDRHHRSTFLPSVWEQLPDARDFLSHLKMKAGLTSNHWSDSIRFSRYETESF